LSNWLKVGVPVLIAVLLIVAAVSITIAVTKDNTVKQLASAPYTPQKTGDIQLAQGGLCPNCPGYGQGGPTGDQGTANGPGYEYNSGVYQGSCHGSNYQGNSTTSGYGGGCCRGR
jgi:hypothetical protein